MIANTDKKNIKINNNFNPKFYNFFYKNLANKNLIFIHKKNKF